MLLLTGLLTSLFLSDAAWAISKLDQAVLGEYLKIHSEYREKSCRPGVEETYAQLDLAYRGDGNYVPFLANQKIDEATIKAAIPLLKEKIVWIKEQMGALKKIKSATGPLQILKRIENEATLLQEAKKDYFFTRSRKQKKRIEKKAEKQFGQVLKEVEAFKEAAPYLLSFKFPLDHLSLRAEYDKFKGLHTKEARARANAVYLYRKIVQDGSYDENLVRNDSVVRAAFDTLYLSLTKEKERSFLTENERSDLKYVVDNFRDLLGLLEAKGGGLFARFEEWEKRVQRSLDFYQSLLVEEKKLGKEAKAKTLPPSNTHSILSGRSRALHELKEFVLKKEAESYIYWSKKSDLFQYLFAVETILYAEVGRIDSPDALERKDVIQVVANRFSDPLYNEISEGDPLLAYLPKELDTKANKWLNILFKEGEFSFTYFYIPGNRHIYCPDVSRVGQYLRRENLRLALELSNNPRKNFPAIRYFSRMSMYGRIEMDSLWNEFHALPETPGNLLKRNSKKITTLYKKGHYKFYYDFTGADSKRVYVVVEMKGRPYVIDVKNPNLVYGYRNPHQFRYFAPVK